MKHDQLRDHIIIPVLKKMGMYSKQAEQLVLGTAIQESRLKYLTQLNDGPARSYYQIEPATLYDLHENYLKHRPDKNQLLDSFAIKMYTLEENLLRNPVYATAACRMIYWRVKGPIPASLTGQAAYWKKHYNTFLGKGTVDEYIKNVQDYI